jgi:hypothetical protein
MIVGPFLRPVPTTSATYDQFAWCYLHLNKRGDIIAIEWCGWW